MPADVCELPVVPWVQAVLRGTKVYARVDAGGAFVTENGRVEIRYKPTDGRKYAARADNLTVVSGAILPDETCGDATSVEAAKSAATPSGSASAKSAAKRVGKKSSKAQESFDPSAHPGGSDAIHVYADGACSGNPGPAGIGVVVLDTESRVEISEYIGQGTNNIAELTAILRALGETADSERALIIHTDSSYSIGVLQKGWKAKANRELIAQLREVLSGRGDVTLVYVPGHAGVKWNERADALARDAVAYRKSARKVVRAEPSPVPEG